FHEPAAGVAELPGLDHDAAGEVGFDQPHLSDSSFPRAGKSLTPSFPRAGKSPTSSFPRAGKSPTSSFPRAGKSPTSSFPRKRESSALAFEGGKTLDSRVRGNDGGGFPCFTRDVRYRP